LGSGVYTLKKLVIVGGGVTKDRAPYKSDAVIWSTASVGQELPRVDACFELHDGVYGPELLNKINCTIYMKEASKEVPKSVRFPIEKLVSKYGRRFNGTMVMMLAFAHMEGFKEIEIYGIDFNSDEEPGRKMMFLWMMGYLTALGISLRIADGSYLMDTCPTYSYEDNGRAYLDAMKSAVKNQYTELDHNIRAMSEQRAYVKGVVDTVETFTRRYL
jgi:hypothetical protein